MLYLAIALIVSGLSLIFFGVKAFFGVLFISLGFYILFWMWSLHRAVRKKRRETLDQLKQRFQGKLSNDDLQWLASFTESPIGRKVLISIEDNNPAESTKIRIAVPISLISILKPILKVSAPTVWKIIGNKQHALDYDQFKFILNVVTEVLDEIISYSGDFVRIETTGTLVRISIV